MEDFLTNDAAILIINEMDYDDTRRWCQTNQQFRRQCNLKYWLHQIRIDLDLTSEQANDLISHIPDDVTTVIYYKWLKMWFNKMSAKNFLLAAEQGLLPIVKLYHYRGLKVNNYPAFVNAAVNGHLETAKWLYSLGTINIKSYGDEAFRGATMNGHLETAKWIYSLGGNIYIHAGQDYVFRTAAVNGHLETAKWLYSLGGVDIHAKSEYAFRGAALNDQLETAKWIYSLGDVNIYAGNPDAAQWAAKYGHLGEAQWLYSLSDVDMNIDKYVITPRMLKWLNSLISNSSK